jgi:subtilase family serine protease
MTASVIGAGLVTAGLTVAAVGGGSGPAGAATRPGVAATMAGSMAPFVRDARSIGSVPAAERLTIQLWLRPQIAEATQFAQAVSTPGSSQFHQYLSPDAYAARFGATRADATAVEAWLRASGFTAVSADSGRSYVRATAPASVVSQAFAVRLRLYQPTAVASAGGYALRSNDRPVTLPATLASLVLGVTGLDNAAPAAPAIQPASTTPAEAGATAPPQAACSAYFAQHLQGGLPEYLGRTSFPTPVCGYSARQLRTAYGASLTSTGQGQTIALVELAPPGSSDLLALQDYARVSGLPAPSRQRFAQRSAGTPCTSASDLSQPAAASAAPGDTAPGSADIEEQMDIEAAYAMAPGASELVIAGVSCGGIDPVSQGLLDADQAVLDGTGHHPLASITSNSWESGPEGQPASETTIEHATLLQAVAEGVGMYFASGDSPGVEAPSTDPYAIAVGGTSLAIAPAGNRVFETGWSTGLLALQKGTWVNDGDVDDASGGGPSVVWKQPAYQRGVVPVALSRVAGHSGQYRSVPDISADGDPATSMAVGVITVTPGGQARFSLTHGGGTSEATPLVAGLVAAAQQGSRVPFGFLDPVLYRLAGTSALHDDLPLSAATPAALRAVWCGTAACGMDGLLVLNVQGTDKAKGYTGQVTLKGYDNMTGLGTPNGQAFITALRALER